MDTRQLTSRAAASGIKGGSASTRRSAAKKRRHSVVAPRITRGGYSKGRIISGWKSVSCCRHLTHGWEGSITGMGVMNYGALGTYEGDWIDSRKEGRGIFLYGNGDVYVGDWENDQRQ